MHKILIADDQEDVRQALRLLLKAEATARSWSLPPRSSGGRFQR